MSPPGPSTRSQPPRPFCLATVLAKLCPVRAHARIESRALLEPGVSNIQRLCIPELRHRSFETSLPISFCPIDFQGNTTNPAEIDGQPFAPVISSSFADGAVVLSID